MRALVRARQKKDNAIMQLNISKQAYFNLLTYISHGLYIFSWSNFAQDKLLVWIQNDPDMSQCEMAANAASKSSGPSHFEHRLQSFIEL